MKLFQLKRAKHRHMFKELTTCGTGYLSASLQLKSAQKALTKYFLSICGDSLRLGFCYGGWDRLLVHVSPQWGLNK